MADYAVAYDRRPAEAVYGSALINRVTYSRAADGTERHTDPDAGKCARLLPHLTGSRVFAPLQDHPRFRAAVGRMTDCVAGNPIK